MSFSRRAPEVAQVRRLAVALTLAIGGLVTACGPAYGQSTHTQASAAPSSVAQPLPSCRYDDLPAVRAGLDDWRTTLVDTIYRLPARYVPTDLVSVADAGLVGRGSVREFVVDDLAAMAAAARSAGATLTSVSAYRSEESQVAVFKEWESVAGYDGALATAARPGHSEHQLGTAIDFGSPGDVQPWAGDWGNSPQGRWLAANAWRYGFILSYPPGLSPTKTCYTAEPWHYRYFGKPLAAQIHASGLSSREYLWKLDEAEAGAEAQAASASASAASIAASGAGPGPASIAAQSTDTGAARGQAGATPRGAVARLQTPAPPVDRDPGRSATPATAGLGSLTPAALALTLAAVLLGALVLARPGRPERAASTARARVRRSAAPSRSIRETRLPRAEPPG